MKKFLFSLIIIGPFWSKPVISQNVYYISSKGSDSNSGISPESPLKTINKIKGDTKYLLKKGDTLYFNINKTNSQLGKIIISSYGIGPKPILSLYKKIKKQSWLQHKDNLWKVKLSDSTNYSGFFSASAYDVGFLKIGKGIKGNKLTAIDSLKSQWDFFSDKDYLYVFSTIILSSYSVPIQIASNVNFVQLSNNFEIKGIQLIGTGGHGIQGIDVENVLIDDVDISEIGGCFLVGYASGTTRYGNGIEFYNSASNCLIKNCKVSEVYDAAFTMQGKANELYFKNITFQNNYSERNEQSFEFWIRGGKSGFRNCMFVNNNCSNVGYGWSHKVRPEKNSAVHILNSSWQVNESDLSILNNTFSKALTAYISFDQSNKQRPLFKSNSNTINLDSASYKKTVSILQLKSANGRRFNPFDIDSNSTFNIK